MIKKSRISSIDMLRGLVMIIMALDHTRDFTHADALLHHDPLNFATTSGWLFMTRWITHFCAPVFVFLSGTSAFFVSLKKTKKELAVFLLTRGLWLMLAEFTIVLLGWDGGFSYAYFGFFVIWILGLSMVLMSALIFLPRPLMFIIGAALVVFHNLFDVYNSRVTDTLQGFVLSALHVKHDFMLDQHHTFSVTYPFIPWLGVMILGFFFGSFYDQAIDQVKRKKILVSLGLSCILLFILLRSGNFYGDFNLWQQQPNGLFTFFDFIDTTKYPPSLLYLLMTLGPAFLLLAWFEKLQGRITDIIVIYGRVPFFYYLLHIYLIHIIALLIFFGTGHQASEIQPGINIGGLPPGFGLHLWQVHLVWISVVVMLYFPCKWYNQYKSTHHHVLLSYL